MDTVSEQSRALNRRLSASDRDRIDQYATAVRETERRMEKAREWERLPKPVPSADSPIDPGGPAAYMEKTKLMYEIARLAFESDSTRSIALLLDSNNSPTIKVSDIQISDGYHNLSHHGKDEKKLAQLEAIDRNHMRLISQLISDFKNSKEGETSLLENSLILYGSNLGDANKHTTDNMPMLVAGGRLKHGQHLAFDRDKNYPLPNLFVAMLQSMGIETDKFASSTGTMKGLDLKSIS